MGVLYPIGVPALMFGLLYLHRRTIKRVMRIKKALEGESPLETKGLTPEQKAHEQAVLDALRQKEEVSVSVIARADSARRASLIMGAQLVAAPAPAAAPEWFEGWDDGHARHISVGQKSLSPKIAKPKTAKANMFKSENR